RPAKSTTGSWAPGTLGRGAVCNRDRLARHRRLHVRNQLGRPAVVKGPFAGISAGGPATQQPPQSFTGSVAHPAAQPAVRGHRPRLNTAPTRWSVAGLLQHFDEAIGHRLQSMFRFDGPPGVFGDGTVLGGIL